MQLCHAPNYHTGIIWGKSAHALAEITDIFVALDKQHHSTIDPPNPPPTPQQTKPAMPRRETRLFT